MHMGNAAQMKRAAIVYKLQSVRNIHMNPCYPPDPH